MTDSQSRTTTVSDRWSYLWLVLGALALPFGVGIWAVPIVAWVGPVFRLRFMRTQRPLRGFLIAALAFALVFGGWALAAEGMLGRGRTPVSMAIALGFAGSMLAVLPLLVDRLIAPRLSGLLSTLAYPLISVTSVYLVELAAGGRFIGSLAYSQYGDMPLVQIVSVTGLWGLQFLVIWLASVVNLAWERGFRWLEIRTAVGSYALVLSAVLLFGGARLSLFQPDTKTVRVAAITTPGVENLRDIPSLDSSVETLASLTTQAVTSGAKIVVWQELAAIVSKNDEATFVARGREIAKKNGIYLLMAMDVVDSTRGQLRGNKAVMVDPTGAVAYDYLKHYHAAGAEARYYATGQGKIPVVSTPYGRLSSVICYDLDFPLFVGQLKSDVDILLVPAWDWKAIAFLHMQAGTFRAIEHGFSLVRPSGEGLSAAVDPYGRTLAMLNYLTATDHVLIADVPIKGVGTAYSMIGDLFAWLCIAGIVTIAVWSWRRRSNQTPSRQA
jgi:apolipoprotein N-acyltransferase